MRRKKKYRVLKELNTKLFLLLMLYHSQHHKFLPISYNHNVEHHVRNTEKCTYAFRLLDAKKFTLYILLLMHFCQQSHSNQ